MFLEFIIALCFFVVGERFFKNFQGETPRAATIRKWLVYFALVVILTLTPGRPWSLIWALAPAVGSIGHFAWCFRNGIHPLSAEPRDRYYALRGWKIPDQPKP